MSNDELAASLIADKTALAAINTDLDTVIGFVTSLTANAGVVPSNVEEAAGNLSSFLTTVKLKADSAAGV